MLNILAVLLCMQKEKRKLRVVVLLARALIDTLVDVTVSGAISGLSET